MRIGRMRRRIRVQRLVAASDGQGGTTNTWTDIATVDASVTARGGREFQTAQQTRATLTHEVRLRWELGHRLGINSTMRLVTDLDEILMIAAPPLDFDGRRTEMVLYCESVAGDVVSV